MLCVFLVYIWCKPSYFKSELQSQYSAVLVDSKGDAEYQETPKKTNIWHLTKSDLTGNFWILFTLHSLYQQSEKG